MTNITKQSTNWSLPRIPRRTWLFAMSSLVLSLTLVECATAAPSDFKRTHAEFLKPDGTQVLVAAHRGLSGLSTGAWQKYPENSLAAIANSIAQGIDIVEVDVRKTKDGEIILILVNQGPFLTSRPVFCTLRQ